MEDKIIETYILFAYEIFYSSDIDMMHLTKPTAWTGHNFHVRCIMFYVQKLLLHTQEENVLTKDRGMTNRIP